MFSALLHGSYFSRWTEPIRWSDFRFRLFQMRCWIYPDSHCVTKSDKTLLHLVSFCCVPSIYINGISASADQTAEYEVFITTPCILRQHCNRIPLRSCPKPYLFGTQSAQSRELHIYCAFPLQFRSSAHTSADGTLPARFFPFGYRSFIQRNSTRSFAKNGVCKCLFSCILALFLYEMRSSCITNLFHRLMIPSGQRAREIIKSYISSLSFSPFVLFNNSTSASTPLSVSLLTGLCFGDLFVITL